MKKFWVLVLLIPLVGFLLVAKNKVLVKNLPSPTPTFTIPRLNTDNLWSLIENWRQSKGLKPYIKDQRLCDIASDRVDDFDYNHSGLYAKYSNYPYVISENLVWNSADETAALDQWLNSPTHLENLEKPYTHSCIACVNRYCVQIFSSFSTDKNNPY